MKAIIAIIAVIVLSAGVSSTANRALPGDSLYTVKVNINEKLSLALAGTTKAKTNLEVKYAQRRLQESFEIFSGTSINSETIAQLEENFTTHTENVKASIKEMEATDLTAATDLAVNFQTALLVHDQILIALSNQAQTLENKTEIDRLRSRVSAQVTELQTLREEVEGKITTQEQPQVKAAAEGRLTAAENKIAEVSGFITTVEGRLGAQNTTSARSRLVAAQQLADDGKLKMAEMAYGEAFDLFSKSISVAQEAQLLVDLKINLNAEVPVPAGNLPNPSANQNLNQYPNLNLNLPY